MGPRLRLHRSKPGLLPALVLGSGVALASACHPAPTVTTRTVVAYVPQACAADGGAYAEYFAYGDFDPAAPPATGHFLGATGAALPEIDTQARAMVMTAGESQRAWEGVTAVPASGDVSLLLLPTLASCALSAPVGGRTGSVLAPIGDQRVLVVGGTGNPTPSTFVARLDTGEVDSLGSADLKTARTGASVTAFPGGALVAGGSNDTGALATAEVFSTSSGGFDQDPFPLAEARTQHGAVVLANGQTLLVGGLGSTGELVPSMETVDPAARSSQEEGVGNLRFPRLNPVVLRMASAEILVAGGFKATGEPENELEWFNPDATPETNKTTVAFAQGSQRAFTALEGGGALAVVTPPAGTAPAGFQNVWVIDATGALQAAAPIPPPLTTPALFGGAGGAPVLWTGDRWLQWQPYAGAFGEISVVDDVMATIGDATCAPDPGLAMWLDTTNQQLTLLRFDTRNAYSALPGPLLVTGPDEMSPDRLGGVTWDVDTGLTLAPGTPGAAAFVTDRTYADVTVEVDVTSGGALVAIRDEEGVELDVPGAGCPGFVDPGGAVTLTVTRRGTSVTWSASDGSGGACTDLPRADARVSVGVRAGATAPGVVKDFRVTRLGAP